ncbi:prepilin peptidase [bacterium]|nr:prepilin peptidase [bacterium]MBU1636610.1 prepilin peptidase [bacterium]MBU1920060.1 prepilin peptidase [bacterium]
MVESPWGPLPGWLVFTFALILGGSLGSFANVLIYRLPEELSLLRPASRCPKCGRAIKPVENIPVISWILLGGRCKGCGESISIQYPLIEAASAIIIMFCVFKWGVTYQALAYGLLFIGLIALILIDLRHWLLPFAITIPLTVVGLAGAILFGMRPWADSLIGMGVGFAIFLVMLLAGKWIFKKEALGGGDVVFGMMAGAFLGWKSVILMMFVASFLGTLLAVIMLISGKEIAGRSVPFGPFLAIALVICLFTGDAMIAWYINMFAH